jgi:beta-galactosidase/beta-glucuronidase
MAAPGFSQSPGRRRRRLREDLAANAATVPGTVLTSMVNDGIYPEPMYGENNRETVIPESLNKTSYWYRTTFTVPKDYSHRQVWVHFDGANFSSEVWVSGTQVGTIQGAFIRGLFDITQLVKPGDTAVLAVKVSPQRSRQERWYHRPRRCNVPLHHWLGLAQRRP